MDWLRQRLKELGVSGADFGRALGVPKARVYEMQRGDRKLQPNEIGPAARALRWTEAELVARLEGRNPRPLGTDHEVDIAGARPLQRDDRSLRALVIYRTAANEKGHQGDFMLRAEHAGEVVRPDFLRFSEKAFAAKVLDDRNTPAYRRRDVILVDPDSPPIEDEDCLFTGNFEAAGGAGSVIGCLVSSTASCWKVRQYGMRGERELPRSEFPNAWPIVGRYNRR
jgi:hypothetical protein